MSRGYDSSVFYWARSKPEHLVSERSSTTGKHRRLLGRHRHPRLGGALSPATRPPWSPTPVHTETQAKWAAWWGTEGRSLPEGSLLPGTVGEPWPPVCVWCVACERKTVSTASLKGEGVGNGPIAVSETRAAASSCQDPESGKAPILLKEQDVVHGTQVLASGRK